MCAHTYRHRVLKKAFNIHMINSTHHTEYNCDKHKSNIN